MIFCHTTQEYPNEVGRAAGAVSFRTFIKYIQILNDLNKVKEKEKRKI